MANLIGQSLGRYHILEQLGEGGMALVYKAFDTRLERHVAIKVILPGKEHSEKFLKRFEREAKALAQLSHPNIVKVIDYGEYEGLPYLVMEYLPGGTLKQKLGGKSIAWQDAIEILVPIARALGYAHQNRIIHRDIKPSNILITQSGEPMLSDFGIAKVLEAEETMDLTGAGVGVGTPEYMSPEQAQGQPVDPRSDVYSLGVVFYEMVTGRKPYQADTPMAVIWKLASEPLPSPRKFQPSLPDRVEAVLVKVLARNPQNRFQSMSDLVKVLSQLNTERPSVVFDRRGLRFWAGAGVLTVLAVTAFVWWWSVARLPSVRLPETSDGTDPSEVSPGAGATPTDAPVDVITASPTHAASIPVGETNGTYLMDLTPLSARATHNYLGYGVYPWSEGPMSEGEPIFLFGRYFEHSIFAHAPSSLTYDLGGNYERLETQLYYFGPCQPVIDGAISRIFGDNELLYEGPILNYGKNAVTVDVPLTNVHQLILATDPLSNDSCDWTIWLEPMLIPSRPDPTPTATISLPSMTSTPFTFTTEKDLTTQIVDSFPDKDQWITYSEAGNPIINSARDTDFVWATPVTIPIPEIAAGRLALDLYLTMFGNSCKNEFLFVFEGAEDFGTGDRYIGNANARTLQFIFLDNRMLDIESNITKTLSLQPGSNVDLRLFMSKNRQGDIEMEIHELSPLGFDYPGTFLDVLTLPADWTESNYSPNIGFDIGGGCRMELRGIVIRK